MVDKPPGMTSHDVVARCRRALGQHGVSQRRVGHAGTLDPAATGVLLLGVGRGTRLLRFCEAYDKEYVAEVVFGAATTTQDAEGEVIAEKDALGLDAARVEKALERFRGEIEQVPPMVSAVKVGGEPLYRKARRGEEIERAPRRVVVHEAELASFAPGERARATLRVRCSKGTYVRTLAADLGEALGTGAHLSGLRRTRVGPFGVADAIALDAVSTGVLRPMADAVAGYPRHAVDAEAARALGHGKSLPAAGIEGPYAVFGPDGLVAMAEDREGEVRTLCVVTG